MSNSYLCPIIPSGTFDMVAKTQAGFEQVLAGELTALGAQDVRPMRRAVAFCGTKETLYRANLWLRSALRVLIPLRSTTAHHADELYDRAAEIRWTDFFSHRDTFAIECTASGELHPHSLFASQVVKDAIADQFRNKYNMRPSVELNQPTLRINVHIQNADVTFSLDASGDSLHKRGYRLEKGAAPLNEVMAAGMILLTGWKGDTDFVDFFCGSGTLLIEAAGYSMNVAPGLWRDQYGFQKWKDYDPILWNRLMQEANEKIRHPAGTFLGSDISVPTLDVAKRNIHRAGMSKRIELRNNDFTAARPPRTGGGIIITNPPYGERIQPADIEQMYESIGDTLKQHFKGYEAWILSGNPEAVKKVGLKAGTKIPLLNAAIECQFLKYELYEGSRR